MGCSGSKAEDLPLVIRCRERRELIRAAANHRYALAAAHVSYFRSLKDVGDALRRFVDEELVTTSPDSSVSSPSLTLPPSSKKNRSSGGDESSMHLHDDEDESHLDISDSSSSGSEDVKHYHNHHNHDSEDDRDHVHRGKGFNEGVHNAEESTYNTYPRGGGGLNFNGYGQGFGFGDEMVNEPYNMYPNSYPPQAHSYNEPYIDQWGSHRMQQPLEQPWYYPNNNSDVFYMKKSAPVSRTFVHEPPGEPSYGYSDSYWTSPTGYENAGNYGYFSMGSPVRMGNNEGPKVNKPKEAPPPPSPKASGWDFFNPFEVFDNGYPGYYSSGKYGYGSTSSSPDSTEVREREGIPELEEETESEVFKEVLKGKRMKAETKKSYGDSKPVSRAAPVHKNGEGSLKSVPMHTSESSSRSLPSWTSEESEKSTVPPGYSEDSDKPSTSRTYKDGSSWVNQTDHLDMGSSISLTDEKSSEENVVSKSVDKVSVKKKGVTFEMDGDSSKMSSVTLLSLHGNRDLREVVAEIRDEFETASSYGVEVATLLEVGKVPYQPSFLKVIISRVLYLISPSLALRDSSPSMQSVKLASKTVKLARSYFDDVGNDDEERLRVIYEKQCKRLQSLDEEGAESTKIDATRASITRLLTKLDVSLRAIDAISSRIHKLRDEELQPQVAALIHGLIRMWKAMLNCHQKQFQAIMESKMRKLKANTVHQTDPTSRASTELERELRVWSDRFNDWIKFQKSYVESLNGWLLQCLQYEPEMTPDGPIPYSPGQLGAPPIFVISHDWHQAMDSISEARVANAMNTFATSLRQLWEKQDEQGHQRLKTEYISKDKKGNEQDTISDKTGLSVVQSDNGVSPLDDLKVDLDDMRQKLAEDRIKKHKDAMKLVHDAASSSLQGGLVPIFKALENFTSDALKAHEHVRLQQENHRL